MKGDFSRDTFDPLKHFTRVLMQQGRVQLDADWNEQTALLWHYIRALSADLIGPHGGPDGLCGFAIVTPDKLNTLPDAEKAGADELGELKPSLQGNFLIGTGRYYVGGLLCENERVALYAPSKNAPGYDQRDHLADELSAEGNYFVYLDAWEQHVTAFEDDSIREVALGSQGPDTTTRARVAWQVRAVDIANMPDFSKETCQTILNGKAWLYFTGTLQPESRGRLRAKAEEPEDPDSFEPCIVSPEARFRGAENQLYRVEIHRGGTVGAPATFKWSRENGSVVLPVRSVSGKVVTLDSMGRDARSGVEVGDWVELYERDSPRIDDLTPLVQVVAVDPVEMTVTLSAEPHAETERDERGAPAMSNPLLRRWDQKEGDTRRGGQELRDGAAIITEGAGDDEWLELEDGVRIQFQPGGNYRAGDYWLIPARTETGDVEWPGGQGRPEARPPHGVEHHYAPLARITVGTGRAVTVQEDFRRRFLPLARCAATRTAVIRDERDTAVVTPSGTPQ
ncbi:MAG TPA: DUF6519 domain-containing protein [Pyrinomonadaceae bacterium]|jgi:hypothetical protein|nr:DUF6519 domain-containing protein [Pyrinomonadaceae bacterium]